MDQCKFARLGSFVVNIILEPETPKQTLKLNFGLCNLCPEAEGSVRDRYAGGLKLRGVRLELRISKSGVGCTVYGIWAWDSARLSI